MGMTDVLRERPVARDSLITGDIASEIDDAVSSEGDEEENADSDGFIVKSGEDWDIEESSVVPEGGEKGPAIVAPEIPTADVPPPTAAVAPSDLPLIDIGPPADDKVRTMEGMVPLGDQSSDDLKVERFSDDPSSGSLAPRPPRPSASRPAPRRPSTRVSTPPRASAAHRRQSAAHRSPGHGRRPKPKNRISGFKVLVGVAFAVALGVALTKFVPFGATGFGGTDAPAVGPASQGNATPAPARPAPAPIQPVDTTSIAISPFDSVLDSMEIDLGLDKLPSNVLLISVEGLVVETLRVLITPGGMGSRVIQILESGERLTLTVFPLDEDAARDLVHGEVQVANITESIAQGIVRFGDYEVRARAAISSDSLEVLLQQLVESQPTG